MAIVPKADQNLCNTFHGMVRAGFNVVMFVVEQYVDFPSIEERARLLGFRAYHIPDSQALRRWQHAGAHVR